MAQTKVQSVVPPRWVELLGYRVRIKVRVLPRGTWAQTTGWDTHRPVVTLSTRLLRQPKAYVETVLAHELAHVAFGLTGLHNQLKRGLEEAVCEGVVEHVVRTLQQCKVSRWG